MVEATIVLFGGAHDGQVLPLRAIEHSLPDVVEMFGPSFQQALILDNLPRPVDALKPSAIYRRTREIDHSGNVIYQYYEERET